MDQHEFTTLLRRHLKLVHKISAAYCRNPSDRNDIAQEIIVQLWRSRERYDGRAAQSTWIYRIALNVAISCYRRERRHGLPALDAEAVLIVDERAVEPNPDLRILLRCIDELDELDRALVLLHLDGNDHATIAEILGISATNVGTKLGRLKTRLRRSFDSHSNPQAKP